MSKSLVPGSLVFELPHGREKVPSNLVGIYSFSVRFPSDYELGLKDQVPDPGRVLETIKHKVRRYASAYAAASYSGQMENEVTSLHLRRVLEIRAQAPAVTTVDKWIEEFALAEGTSIAAFQDLTNVLRKSFELSNPLYVGMTVDQSFASRLSQHVDGQTGFSNLCKQHNLLWTELTFQCIPLEGFTSDGVRAVERLVQNIFKPIFCRG